MDHLLSDQKKAPRPTGKVIHLLCSTTCPRPAPEHNACLDYHHTVQSRPATAVDAPFPGNCYWHGGKVTTQNLLCKIHPMISSCHPQLSPATTLTTVSPASHQLLAGSPQRAYHIIVFKTLKCIQVSLI